MIDYNRFKTLNLDAGSPVDQGLSQSGCAQKHDRVFQQPERLCDISWEFEFIEISMMYKKTSPKIMSVMAIDGKILLNQYFFAKLSTFSCQMW